MNKNWSDEAWDDYMSWQSDKRIVKKINKLIKDIDMNAQIIQAGDLESQPRLKKLTRLSSGELLFFELIRVRQVRI